MLPQQLALAWMYGSLASIGDTALACFEAAGTDMSAVDVPFLMSTSGALTVDLAEVTLVAKVADAKLR